jgi:hypothetical protein
MALLGCVLDKQIALVGNPAIKVAVAATAGIEQLAEAERIDVRTEVDIEVVVEAAAVAEAPEHQQVGRHRAGELGLNAHDLRVADGRLRLVDQAVLEYGEAGVCEGYVCHGHPARWWRLRRSLLPRPVGPRRSGRRSSMRRRRRRPRPVLVGATQPRQGQLVRCY